MAVLVAGAAALLCTALWAPSAHAYPMYDSDPGPGVGTGCVNCHTGFQGGPGAALHNQHVNGFSITQCNSCHPAGAGTTPVRTYDSGVFPGVDPVDGGFGCAGCHGRDYGDISGDGEPKPTAWGLRQHHANNGVAICQGCHATAAILPENVAPPYFGLASNNLSDPCDSTQEDLAFDVDAVGLDNDGDGLIDAADPDCPVGTTTTTTLPPPTNVGITGKKLIIVDKLDSSGKAKVVYVAKDAPAGKGTTNDPSQISATLDYQSPTLGASGSVAMAQGANWLVNKETVAKYVNKEAPGGPGAVKVAVIKPGKLLKAVSKDLGDSGSAIDIYGTGDPSPSTVDMATQYTVVDGGTVRRHCGEFTDCARKIIAGGSGAKVVCKTATPGGSVTCPASPSGAFLD